MGDSIAVCLVLLFLNIPVITNAVSDTTPLVNVQRLAGLNRMETSIAIAKEQYTDKVPDAVVLATANNFADALAGSGLAYKHNAPLLLVNKNVSNSKTVLEYITTNLSKEKNIYILGGTGAVSSEISDYLTTNGYNIIRLGGKDRYETNQKIVDYLKVPKGTSIVIATGSSFADALSILSIADIKGYPILLNGKDNLLASVSSNITIVRLGGKDRYETSMKIIEYFNLDTDTITSLKQPISYTYGNTSGNLTNGGSVVSDGQYNYYLNSSDGYKLYKNKPDGSSKSKISDSVCGSLNTIGDWIYYSDTMVGKGIYKMKKDGSSKTLIVNSQTMGIAVVNDWIYYLEKGASESQENFLYKIKTDGTSKKKIDFETGNSLVCIEAQAIVVIENWVYLSLLNKADNNIGLYRIKTDGSTTQRVSSSSPRFFSIEDGWIYYSDDTYQKINKAKVDGSSEEVLYTMPDSNYALYGINASNGYVYFSNYTDSQPDDKLGIYRMKTDGSELVKLVSGSEWIYFESPGSSTLTYANGVYTVAIGGSSQILKLKTDGSELFQVN
ncbi:DUF5050 domain-containing protein [Clostridium sp.]|uniref:DUF5050 domain-containing protein n=1 Tax=Clostridium sp. TaxID=1506 RepID=UPI003F4C525E